MPKFLGYLKADANYWGCRIFYDTGSSLSPSRTVSDRIQPIDGYWEKLKWLWTNRSSTHCIHVL